MSQKQAATIQSLLSKFALIQQRSGEESVPHVDRPFNCSSPVHRQLRSAHATPPQLPSRSPRRRPCLPPRGLPFKVAGPPVRAPQGRFVHETVFLRATPEHCRVEVRSARKKRFSRWAGEIAAREVFSI